MSILFIILVFVGVWLLIAGGYIFFVLCRGGRNRRTQPHPRHAQTRFNHGGSGRSDDSFAALPSASTATYTSTAGWASYSQTSWQTENYVVTETSSASYSSDTSNSDTNCNSSSDTGSTSWDSSSSSSSSSDFGGGGSGGDW